jgi:hypothetical protein
MYNTGPPKYLISIPEQQRQVPVAQTTEKRTHKLKSLLIKPIIIRAQRGYINHGTLYYTNLTHTHTHIYT